MTYRCSLVKFRGQQCAASVCLVFDSTSSDIQLFRAADEHTHQNHANAVSEIPNEVQAAIQMLYENNVTKPKQMSLNLAKKGFEVPPIPKLRNFLKKLNDAKYGQEKIHCGTLEKWLKENTPLPDRDTQPFVVNYDMNYIQNAAPWSAKFLVSTTMGLHMGLCLR